MEVNIMEHEIKSTYLKKFLTEIQYNNRNPKDTKAIELLNDISTNPERVLEPGCILYRSRIIKNGDKIFGESPFWGFDEKGSFVPPKRATRDMRANYRYIPYLYCSNHPYISIVEIRPRLGSCLSMASLVVTEKIRLLDLTMKNVTAKMTEAKKNLFEDLSYLYSKPITEDDDVLDYIPTQFIAEFAKNIGYDGIAYKSSLTPEYDADKSGNFDRFNIVIFNYKKCKVVSSNKICVKSSFLECEQVDLGENKLDVRGYVQEKLDEIIGIQETYINKN